MKTALIPTNDTPAGELQLHNPPCNTHTAFNTNNDNDSDPNM